MGTNTNYEEICSLLKQNPKSSLLEAVRILIKVADNVLKTPHNPKYRTLMKNNPSISTKLLSVSGSKEVLYFMGFKELTDSFVLNMDCDLKKVLDCKDKLLGFQKTINSSEDAFASDKQQPVSGILSVGETHPFENLQVVHPTLRVTRLTIPPYVPKFTNNFLRQIEREWHYMLMFEDPVLRRRASEYIPVEMLGYNAVKRMRLSQKSVKEGKAEDLDVALQDYLLIELMTWFKYNFFSWVDNPPCDFCDKRTEFSHIATDLSSYLYTDRVELHKCLSCEKLTPFPRYNDLNVLLETRRGRCGEWAKVFCLFCRCLGWHTRFVIEEGDHVWVEIYSPTQGRWIHCDPCERVCDKPLMYERGWKKRISYVIAYSCDEVQDVTWRYTGDYKAALSRRNYCTEAELLDCIMKLRAEREKQMSSYKKKYVTKRLLEELSSLLGERSSRDEDEVGRKSGALDWRLARHETEDNVSGQNQYVWEISDYNIVNNEAKVQYSASLDKYNVTTNDGKVLVKSKWQSGVFKCENVFKKEEHDWKTVYLARREGCDTGEISWKFRLANKNLHIEKIFLNFEYTTYENGKVDINVSSGKECFNYKSSFHDGIKFNSICTEVTITASLTGGKGDVAWQHAQLFRQPMDENKFPFHITFKIKNK